jgi:hypothetical protein
MTVAQSIAGYHALHHLAGSHIGTVAGRKSLPDKNVGEKKYWGLHSLLSNILPI